MSIDPSRRDLLKTATAGLGFLGCASFAPAAIPAGVLTFRHVHLDFHTSPAITGVGEHFNAEEFARVLKEAAVNSITIFGKCHHGMAYYPTKVGMRHPNLKVDLVGGMIEACHRQGIRVPVYLSTSLDQHIWREHVEWRALNSEGKSYGHGGAAGPLSTKLGYLCSNTPYTDYLSAQVEEILQNYDADGIFYDNYTQHPAGCFGDSCMKEREKLGLDSANPGDCRKHSHMVMKRVMGRWAALVRSRKPKASIYINGQFPPQQRTRLRPSGGRRLHSRRNRVFARGAAGVTPITRWPPAICVTSGSRPRA